MRLLGVGEASEGWEGVELEVGLMAGEELRLCGDSGREKG